MKEKVKIRINGKETTAYRGGTVLASLTAAGYKILKKSKKLHENRGPLCAMGVCYECQVNINGIPNQRACMTEVKDEMMILTDES